MKSYYPVEYLLIDIANNFGKDKLLFEERIQWAKDNLNNLEALADEAETKPLYIKAVQALRKAQKGEPLGHLVGLDSCSSGLQLLSVLSGCKAGAEATGLVNPNKRADAYTEITDMMNEMLGGTVHVSRKDSKQALMTSLYGSKATPKRVFGEDTPELKAFYLALQKMAPGAYELLHILLKSWNPHAYYHEWKMPDGFDVKVKVMSKHKETIEVDELGHHKFTYEYYENEPVKFGLSNPANLTHAIDSYVLRTLHRKCNYDKEMVLKAKELLENHQALANVQPNPETKIGYYVQQYQRSTLADIVILPWIVKEEGELYQISQAHKDKLLEMINQMLEYEPFELVTIHDEFKALCGNCNYLRQQYINTLVDLANSNLMQDLLRQLYKNDDIIYLKKSDNLAKYIANSNYGIC